MKSVFFILIILLILPFFCYGIKHISVSVIFPSDINAYLEAWIGFLEFLDDYQVSLKVTKYNLEEETPEIIFSKINKQKPDLIVTLGTEASKLAKKNISDIPIVFSMVLDPIDIGLKAKNLTGSSLDIPLRIQFKTIKKINHRVKKIGVIYNPLENNSIIQKAKIEAKNNNLVLKKFPVNSTKEIPRIDDMNIDALLLIPDNIVCQSVIIQHILLASLKNKIPVIGISPAYVKAGALFAFSCDYKDIGRQSGNIALRILNGEDIKDIPISIPRKTKLFLNLTVAKRIGLKLNKKIIEEAVTIYGE